MDTNPAQIVQSHTLEGTDKGFEIVKKKRWRTESGSYSTDEKVNRL